METKIWRQIQVAYSPASAINTGKNDWDVQRKELLGKCRRREKYFFLQPFKQSNQKIPVGQG